MYQGERVRLLKGVRHSKCHDDEEAMMAQATSPATVSIPCRLVDVGPLGGTADVRGTESTPRWRAQRRSSAGDGIVSLAAWGALG